MARLPRLVLPGHAHLVVQRALPGVQAFVDDLDHRTWRAALQEGLQRHGIRLHAWVAHPAEVRLVLTPPDGAALAQLMQHLGRRCVAAYRRRHGGQGTVWDGRYRCAALAPGEPVLDAMRWVEGLAGVGVPSSRLHHLGRGADRLLTDPPAFWTLGNTPFEREDAWRALLDGGLPAGRVAPLEQALRGGWVVGDADFAAEAAAAGRPASPRPRGRPRRARPPEATSTEGPDTPSGGAPASDAPGAGVMLSS
jgi:putative transposase